MTDRRSLSSWAWWDDVRAIRGWLTPSEARLLRLAAQLTADVEGNVLEIGVYRGQSAVALGFELGPDEVFCAVDPFGIEADAAPVRAEQSLWYEGLDRSEFERNFRRVHGREPVVLQRFSSEVTPSDLPTPFRLIHVDGAHDYESVRGDIDLSLDVLSDGGMLVLDDVVNPHSPGVAAAVWTAVTSGRLAPLLITNKLYCCRPDTYDALHGALVKRLDEERWVPSELPPLTIAGYDVARDPAAPDLDEIAGWNTVKPPWWRGLRAWVPPAVVAAASKAKARAKGKAGTPDG